MVTKLGLVLHLDYVISRSGVEQGMDVELRLEGSKIFDRLPRAYEFDRNA
jgi:hypothetical protein